ncbi:DUF2905 domain-containing protein [Blastopirellula marina]|uniref:DUF2905 domain-containing protein n=1 Tax=Blastopirellula marina DSM 3645 TaxID=314230 RepID=A3ZWK6_9BACT|nr:DUF2905 domain-containing protein [Blastopirellula marina]EAQ78980.1 hypothetical protein DSM3645_13490 [Blastopirellula marina DSM 3645]
MQNWGWILLASGGLICTVGIGLLIASRFSWLGRLPGDIRIEEGGVRFYFPLVTCIVLSVLLSAILSIARLWWR